jgi:hypothetical protein
VLLGHIETTKNPIHSYLAKRKKEAGHPLRHVEPSHGPHGNYEPKTICHHFWPGLIPMPNRWVSGYPYKSSKGLAMQKKKQSHS